MLRIYKRKESGILENLGIFWNVNFSRSLEGLHSKRSTTAGGSRLSENVEHEWEV